MLPRKYSLTSVLLAGTAATLTQLFPLDAAASSGLPLPRCSATSQSFYLMRYIEATTANTAPKTVLELATIPPTGAVALTTIWDGQTAPTASPRDLSKNAGATVAAGMGKDGYIYAMRALGTQEPGWDLQGGAWSTEWRTHTRYYEMLRYGRSGVDNLGIVDGLGTYRTIGSDATTQVTGAVDLRLGPNFNAADIDPVSGVMYLANFQTGGSLTALYRIDVTQTPPKYLSTLTLSAPIPGGQSGDFAIDASGQFAYGIARASGGISTSYRIDLATGAVTSLATNQGFFPFGAAGRLFSGQMAFYNTLSTQLMTLPGGTLGAPQSTTFSDSSDGAACLPKFQAQLVCTPTALVDADNNVSTCSVTLDQPAPAGGVVVALTPPAGSTRYTTTCGSSITVAAGSTAAQCTIVATPNTVPGDGDVTAAIALATPDPLADYELGTLTSASILVQNDDLPTVTVACTPGALVDSANQVSTCTIASNAPAPAGGLSVALTPPAASGRYTSTCGASALIAEGASSATCTITATPNTTPGDGDVAAALALAAPAGGYQLGTPSAASVLISNDDNVAALPVLSLSCTPSTLADAENQVATCQVTLSTAAGPGGVSVALVPPPASDRYTTTCASPLVVPAGATTASCTVTAVPNTVVGDGNVQAILSLVAGGGYELGTAQAVVTITDNDGAKPVPALGSFGTALLTAGLGAFGAFSRRRPRKNSR